MKNSKKQTIKLIYLTLTIIFAIVFLFSVYKIISYYLEASKQEKQFDDIIKEIEQSDNKLLETNEYGMFLEYEKLYEQNNDLVGWIKIEDTKINYPVMLSIEEPDYYLNHNFDKQYSDYGCPYLAKGSDINKPSDNLIIYGHHMKNGTMFSGLDNYKNKEFYNTHKTFIFNTLYEKQTYEVISVFITEVNTGSEDEFKYYRFIDAKTEEEFDDFINKTKELSLYDIDVSANYGDELVTLSTCEASNENLRLVVVGKKTISNN